MLVFQDPIALKTEFLIGDVSALRFVLQNRLITLVIQAFDERHPHFEAKSYVCACLLAG